MSKVAVIGAGFAGLALSYHLLLRGLQVTVFDAQGIGAGASGVSAGLLHPYVGRGDLSWRGEQAMEEADHLLGVSARALGRSVHKRNVLRLALNNRQAARLKQGVGAACGALWWAEGECSARLQGAFLPYPGLFIRSGHTVYAKPYLRGLWQACQHLGAFFERREVDLPILSHFDQVAIAAGSGIKKFGICRLRDLKQNKGQLLVCKKPPYFGLKLSVIGKGYVAMSEDKNCCYIGSTYERDYLDESPCIEEAKRAIFAQVKQFLPLCKAFKVRRCMAGVRVHRQGTSVPLCGKLQHRLWVVTAMGSRGLLYHGLMGKFLAMAMMRDDATLIPKEVRV